MFMRTDAARHPYPNGTRQGDVGYIVFHAPDLARAQAFYGDLLGWTFAPGSEPDGRQVEGVAPDMGLSGGGAAGGMSICWRVDDVAAAVERVRAAGGTSTEPERRPYGMLADCVDDQGAVFYLWQPTDEQAATERDVGVDERPLNGRRHGDVSYLTLEVADAPKTCRFFGAVLGWQFPDEDGDPEGTMPMVGIWGGSARAVGVPMYAVDDVEAAIAHVRAAGGVASDPERKPYGLTADCTDDQGTHFYLGEVS
jgi:predicted enzyme related to lactoylglutathione lyase